MSGPLQGPLCGNFSPQATLTYGQCALGLAQFKAVGLAQAVAKLSPRKRRDKEFCNSITTARSLFPAEPNTVPVDFQSVIVFLVFLLEALFADQAP